MNSQINALIACVTTIHVHCVHASFQVALVLAITVDRPVPRQFPTSIKIMCFSHRSKALSERPVNDATIHAAPSQQRNSYKRAFKPMFIECRLAVTYGLLTLQGVVSPSY
jgi:hypothetical protein